jgi:hypothetical protein
MNFNFERCRSLLLDATLAEMTAHKSIFEQLAGYESGSSECRVQTSAISLCIEPWHGTFDLGLRDDDEKWDNAIRYSVGDWKLYPVGGIEHARSVRETIAIQTYIEQTYGSVGDAHKARETAHLIFLAAAEALLDVAVTTQLRKYQIDAPYVDDDFYFSRCFEYVVTDPDSSIAANYCEIVLANRITQRLKMNLDQSTDKPD